MGHLSRSPQPANAGIRSNPISPAAISPLSTPKSNRKTSTDAREYVTGYRAIAVIETPMRKVEVLESLADGRVLIRDTTYDRERANLSFIHLAYHEARALGNVLLDLEERDPGPPTNGNGKAVTA